LECASVDLPIDPYVLGLWLGDGSSRAGVIATSEEDALEELSYCKAQDSYAHLRDGNHIAVTSDNVRTPNGVSFQSKLRELGLIGNKHVPDMYKRAGWDQRLALLQGLMDSDGSVRRNGHA